MPTDSRLDSLVKLAESGYEFTTREFWLVCGFHSPNMMTKALNVDPRFTSRKSGVIRWTLSR